MQKEEVKIRIKSKHDYGNGIETPIEVTSMGELYREDGYECLSYDEVISADENGQVEVINNLLRIGEEQIELIKGGNAASHMVFVPEETTISYYSTPLGEMEIGIHTDVAKKIDNPNGFSLQLKYDLEMNQTYISSCGLNIAVECDRA